MNSSAIGATEDIVSGRPVQSGGRGFAFQQPHTAKYLVPRPAYEVEPAVETLNRIRAMTLMSNNLVPGASMYVEAGWIVGMPDPNPHIEEHVHDYDEIVMHIGTDPTDQEDLGAEIEFVLDGQPHLINKSSSVFVPRGMKHGPLTWKSFSRSHIEMTIMIGAGSLAEADPGGHRERGQDVADV